MVQIHHISLSKADWTFSDLRLCGVRERPALFGRSVYCSNMQSKKAAFISAASLLLSIAASLRLDAQEPWQVRYRVIQLGTLGGSSSSGNSLNNLGWAMGSANLDGNTTEHAVVWAGGLQIDLGTLGGPNSDVSWPVKNDFGVVAGWAEKEALNPLGESWSCTAFNPTGTPDGHVCTGFVWQRGVMTALPTLGGYNGFATGVNEQGQIAGWAENSVHDNTCSGTQVLQFKPVVYGPDPKRIQELPTYPGDPDGAATAINAQGEVVGISGICDVAVGALTAKHALLWQNGRVFNLGSLGGVGWNTPMAINSRGDIVGFSDLPGDESTGQLVANFHAFIWTKETGRMVDIGTLPGDNVSEALDINDLDQVVGVSFPSAHAFLWQNGKIEDLNSFIPSDSPLVLITASGINNSGQITGQACVIADGGCPFGSDTPAFLAFPAIGGFFSDTEAGRAQVAIPIGIRQQVMRRWTFGASR
jgi:probable HAF family extracellular repeat protein